MERKGLPGARGRDLRVHDEPAPPSYGGMQAEGLTSVGFCKDWVVSAQHHLSGFEIAQLEFHHLH